MHGHFFQHNGMANSSGKLASGTPHDSPHAIRQLYGKYSLLLLALSLTQTWELEKATSHNPRPLEYLSVPNNPQGGVHKEDKIKLSVERMHRAFLLGLQEKSKELQSFFLDNRCHLYLKLFVEYLDNSCTSRLLVGARASPKSITTSTYPQCNRHNCCHRTTYFSSSINILWEPPSLAEL